VLRETGRCFKRRRKMLYPWMRKRKRLSEENKDNLNWKRKMF
jgi:hypothetical protein